MTIFFDPMQNGYRLCWGPAYLAIKGKFSGLLRGVRIGDVRVRCAILYP